jgi:hypothetical protein
MYGFWLFILRVENEGERPYPIQSMFISVITILDFCPAWTWRTAHKQQRRVRFRLILCWRRWRLARISNLRAVADAFCFSISVHMVCVLILSSTGLTTSGCCAAALVYILYLIQWFDQMDPDADQCLWFKNTRLEPSRLRFQIIDRVECAIPTLTAITSFEI